MHNIIPIRNDALYETLRERGLANAALTQLRNLDAARQSLLTSVASFYRIGISLWRNALYENI